MYRSLFDDQLVVFVQIRSCLVDGQKQVVVGDRGIQKQRLSLVNGEFEKAQIPGTAVVKSQIAQTDLADIAERIEEAESFFGFEHPGAIISP